MESAHLTHAHEHARTAATATISNSVLTAGQEHDKAARAFHDAAQDTHNAEALRILSLLEDHHRKLAGLIKEAPRKEKKAVDATKQTDSTSTAQSKTSSRTSSAASTTLPTSRRRLPQSSIATNLAEKRGIPSAKRTTSGTSVSLAGATAGRNEQQSTPVRDLLAQQSRKNESNHVQDAPKPRGAPPQPATPPAEDNFRRFYAAFGGVISAISAPLAFTSLPLNPSTPTPVSEPKEEKVAKTKSRAQSPEASRTVKSSVPDLAALISKPALRALREDGAPPLGPNESFYLVPTSGGTVTYASVLNAQNGTPTTQLNPIDEGSGSMRGSSHEEFVDARESVGPPSPIISRRPRSRGGSTTPSTTTTATTTTGVTPARSIAAGRGTGHKTMEELALENDTLKSVIDKQAKRIQMWELNSQNSFNALAQSFRGARGPTGRDNTNALAQALASQDADTTKRIADLEALLAAQNAKVADLMSNNEQLAKQNERNAQVLGRYREQWEKLKAGARKKEMERREKKGGDAGGGNGGGKEDGRASEVTVGLGVGESVEGGTAGAGAGGEEELEEEPGFGKA
ncbi:hypothetical protein PtrSN002B_005781 [Pyrenophora tritici-repentis]|nr:hypothetical protein Alg215_01238 [Pyrenophora tritici-repentis]KAI1536510.1 hypothetical protein PtrSN001A_005602 [Pyrenophora tritici-repentis]KAI1542722.1 hypothetical protein PtrSN001C_004107 [Pyrenophora tritici-repentis]KAI1551066.1 hypothetical protein PtrSN002B_005781 [Pyrenophora tritici-repentis]KAI1581561.1 hypothetical protein PtrEW7m1_004404 [Pyrenophora tritici-repentis]